MMPTADAIGFHQLDPENRAIVHFVNQVENVLIDMLGMNDQEMKVRVALVGVIHRALIVGLNVDKGKANINDSLKMVEESADLYVKVKALVAEWNKPIEGYEIGG